MTRADAAEMNRRFPERAKLRPADAAGVRQGWAVIKDLWAASKARAAAVHASPTWVEVVAAREDRMAIVQLLTEDLGDADLERRCGEHTLLYCILTVLDEEWHHNWYANRDLDRLLS